MKVQETVYKKKTILRRCPFKINLLFVYPGGLNKIIQISNTKSSYAYLLKQQQSEQKNLDKVNKVTNNINI